MSAEPTVTWATVRYADDYIGIPTWDIECRFSDGRKFAAITVDGNHEALADLLARLINDHALTGEPA